MSARDVLNERATGGAPLKPVKLTPQMAPMSRQRPFSCGSSMGAFGQLQIVKSPALLARKRSLGLGLSNRRAKCGLILAMPLGVAGLAFVLVALTPASFRHELLQRRIRCITR